MLFVPFLSILENALMAIISQRENVVTRLLKEQIMDNRSLSHLMTVLFYIVLSITYVYSL